MTLFTVLQTCPCWGGGMGGWGMGGGAFLWPLLWLVALAAILLGAVYLYSRWNTPDRSDRAIELLREQYATGEIDYEEFDERANRLREHKPP